MSDASGAYVPTWQDRLDPFGHLFVNLDEQIDSMLRAMSDAELDALEAATSQVTRTNCWCYVYEAAPKVHQRIVAERGRRRVLWLHDDEDAKPEESAS